MKNIKERDPVYVSRPLLPDLKDYNELLSDIWESRCLTNNGPYCQKLEKKLESYLNVPTVKVFNNGTNALMCALKLFDLPIGSEVITTPLTFAATAHAISWIGLKPVFADVLPEDLTIDPEAVEKAITNRTSAILAVHVYGSICELDTLQDISNRYSLPLIYDAAHAFGLTVNGQSIASFGDASVFSFHATKLFNTIEGGLIATNNPEDKEAISLLLNFGIKNEEEVVAIGINGKLNELQAAIGLLNIPLIEKEISARVNLRNKYLEFLSDLSGIQVQAEQPGVRGSEQYFPIIIDPNLFGRTRNDIYDELESVSIYSRKYFHPVCTDFLPYKELPIVSTHSTAYVNLVKDRVLCLPFHSGVTTDHISMIRDIFVK